MILPLFQDRLPLSFQGFIFSQRKVHAQRCKSRQNVGAPATLGLRASFKPPEESSNGFGAASHRCFPFHPPGNEQRRRAA
jgi:hypothetical protein